MYPCVLLSIYYAGEYNHHMPEQSDKLRVRAREARRDNRLDEAKQDLIEAVGLCRQSGERNDLASALTALGQIERDLHHNDAALRNYEEAAAIYREEGDVLRLAHTIRHVGDIYRNLKQKELAEPCYREALDLYRGNERTAPLDLANAIRGYALLKDDKGEFQQAKCLWQEARDLYAAVNVDAGVAESSRRLVLLEQT
jgi:tetratricopeptide (TPR) repeat protein